jgi:hypothetical protein
VSNSIPAAIHRRSDDIAAPAGQLAGIEGNPGKPRQPGIGISKKSEWILDSKSRLAG